MLFEKAYAKNVDHQTHPMKLIQKVVQMQKFADGSVMLVKMDASGDELRTVNLPIDGDTFKEMIEYYLSGDAKNKIIEIEA